MNNMVNNTKTKFDFSLLPVIFALAWPTMLEQFMQTAVQYIDTAMVGSLGTTATAAVGSTTTVNWLIGSTISAFGVGFLAYISQNIGAGDFLKAKKAAGQAIFMAVITGVIFTILTLSLSGFVPVWMRVDTNVVDLASKYFFILYTSIFFRSCTIILGTVLRAAGDTKTPMRVGIIVNIVNVVLNYLLIFPSRNVKIVWLTIKVIGANLGVVGAAIASSVAFSIGGIITIVSLIAHKEISPSFSDLSPDKRILYPCLKVAFPNMLQRFCTSLGYVFFASMINSLGEISTAAHTIANTVESAFYVPGYGMMTAAATLTGNAIGADDKSRQKRLSRMIILVEVLMMIVSGGLLFIFAPAMVSLFSKDILVIELGSIVLRMVALSEPFYGVSIVIEGMLQGAGDTVRPFIFSVASMWGVRIIGTFICTQILGMGLVSAWACMIGNNMLLFLLFVLYHKRHAVVDVRLG